MFPVNFPVAEEALPFFGDGGESPTTVLLGEFRLFGYEHGLRLMHGQVFGPFDAHAVNATVAPTDILGFGSGLACIARRQSRQ